MKKILISSFDMEVGGVERSLISMLNNFNYERFQVDLMLYSQTGDFMTLLPKEPNLLEELLPYKTFRFSIGETIKNKQILIGLARLYARYKANKSKSTETGNKQMQYMWSYALPFLPKIKKEYDVAISYLWPHYFVANKVNAKTKIAWIHTDYSTIETDVKMDLKMWDAFDYIVAVSAECKKAFTMKYPSLENKVKVIENITSPDFIRKMANENIESPMKRDKRFKLVTVARLSHAKGIDQAVEALKILKEKGYNDLAWYIVGYGGDEEMIKRMIKDYSLEDSFFLLGKKLNPYSLIKEADLYVQPSRYEGKAVTVVEAQVLGKPVVITNYPTAKSQINHLKDGYITEINPEGIATGIECLYLSCNLRESLSQYCMSQSYSNKEQLDLLYLLLDDKAGEEVLV